MGSWLGCEDAWGSGRVSGGAERARFARVRVFSKKLFGRRGASEAGLRLGSGLTLIGLPQGRTTAIPDRCWPGSGSKIRRRALPGEGAATRSGGLTRSGRLGDAGAAGRAIRGTERGEFARVRVFSKKLFGRRGALSGHGRVHAEAGLDAGFRRHDERRRRGAAGRGDGGEERRAGGDGMARRGLVGGWGGSGPEAGQSCATRNCSQQMLLTRRKTSPGEGTTIRSSRRKTARAVDIRESPRELRHRPRRARGLDGHVQPGLSATSIPTATSVWAAIGYPPTTLAARPALQMRARVDGPGTCSGSGPASGPGRPCSLTVSNDHGVIGLSRPVHCHPGKSKASGTYKGLRRHQA